MIYWDSFCFCSKRKVISIGETNLGPKLSKTFVFISYEKSLLFSFKLYFCVSLFLQHIFLNISNKCVALNVSNAF